MSKTSEHFRTRRSALAMKRRKYFWPQSKKQNLGVQTYDLYLFRRNYSVCYAQRLLLLLINNTDEFSRTLLTNYRKRVAIADSIVPIHFAIR